jgi:hypothetical protein
VFRTEQWIAADHDRNRPLKSMQRSRISIRGEIRLDRIGKRGDEQLVQLMQPYTPVMVLLPRISIDSGGLELIYG